MKMKLGIFILFFIGNLWAGGDVDTYTYPSDDPVMSIDMPSDWQVETDDEGSLCANPSDESLYLELFEVEDAESLDESLEYVDDIVDQWLDDFSLDDPETLKLNGMTCMALDGKGTDEEGDEILASIALFSPDENTVMMLIYFGTEAAEKAHADELETIVAGLKPVK